MVDPSQLRVLFCSFDPLIGAQFSQCCAHHTESRFFDPARISATFAVLAAGIGLSGFGPGGFGGVGWPGAW
jgi:hypothetical protein